MSAASASADISNSHDRDNGDMAEPLLRRSVVLHTPPRQAFSFLGRSSRSTVASEEHLEPINNSSHVANEQQRDSWDGYQASFLHHEAFVSWGFLRWLGVAVAVGLLLAGLSLVFVALSLTAHKYFYDYSFEEEQSDRGLWKWVVITTVGSLLSSGLLLLVAGPHQDFRSGGPIAEPYLLFFKSRESSQSASATTSTCSISSSFRQTLSTLLANAVTVAALPLLGPELALACLARNLSPWLTRWISCTYEEDWTFICFSCVWASFAPLPLLGPLVMLELRSFSDASSTASPAATTSTRSPMQLMTLSTVASISSFSLVQWTLDVSGSLNWSMLAALISMIQGQPSNSSSPASTYDSNNNKSGEPSSICWWHFLAAPCLGAVCGAVTAILLVGVAVLHKLQHQVGGGGTAATSTMARKESIATRFAAITLAGLLQGLLAVLACPLLSLSCLDWIALLLLDSKNEQQLPSTTGQLALLILAQLVSAVVSLGLGQVPGGCILPLVVIGGTVGRLCGTAAATAIASTAATASSVSYLAVMCGMVAGPVALLPMPLTATLTVTLLWADSASQVAPILLASLAAWTVTRGSGLVQRVEQWAYFYPAAAAADSSPPQVQEDEQGQQLLVASPALEEVTEGSDDDDMHDVQLPSDAELIRGIRSAIFGGGGDARIESNLV